MPKIHYVYELIDPRDERVFYVGKGRGGRAWQHEQRVRAGAIFDNAKKTARIQEIISSGLHVAVAIVERFESEQDALVFEAALIDQLPDLTNGGGKWLSHAEQAKVVALRNALTELARKKYRERLLDRFGATGDSAAEEFVSRLAKDWKKTVASLKPPSRYFAPRWLRKGHGVIVTEGDHAGRAGMVARVTHTETVVEMAGGTMIECPNAWLKRVPSG